MNFDEFKQNVEQWAKVRGIYDQSTEAHQQAKALEEIGEYLTAETDEERMDAIGDIAVCIVNAAYFDGLSLDFHRFENLTCPISIVASSIIERSYCRALSDLYILGVKFKFENCLQLAWDSIKDRKGMMIDGKYVKWDNLTEEQREEFNNKQKEITKDENKTT